MTFNISDFIAEINSNGTQSNSKYDVLIPLPPVLVGKFNVRDGFNDVSFNEQAKILSMRCEQTMLPGVALRAGQNNRYGVGVLEKTPFSAGFTETSMMFVTDKNGNINSFWYAWLNLIVNFADSNQLFGAPFKQYSMNYKDHYCTNITINKYDEGGNKIQTVVLNRAYPLSMNEQGLSWKDNDVTRTTVSLTFQDWYSEGNQIGVPTTEE